MSTKTFDPSVAAAQPGFPADGVVVRPRAEQRCAAPSTALAGWVTGGPAGLRGTGLPTGGHGAPAPLGAGVPATGAAYAHRASAPTVLMNDLITTLGNRSPGSPPS